MSSNLLLKRVCEHCGKVFTAKTTVTKFCSDECAKKNYKLRKKQEAVSKSNEETKERIVIKQKTVPVATSSVEQMELIDIKVLSAISSLSERTLYRLLKEEDFPKLMIGKSLRFHKETVINYLVNKYGNV